MTGQQAQSNESVPYWAMRRAADRGRLVLREAIHCAVRDRPDATILEVGSGGGLLASWAAEVPNVGAVIAVEDDDALWRVTVAGLRGHRNRHLITVLRVENLLQWTPPKLWDLLLCDVLSAGLVAQPQVALLNHFLQFRGSGGAVIPAGVSHSIELLGINLSRLPVPLPRICFQDDAGVSKGYELSLPHEVGNVNFNNPVEESLQFSTGVVADADGFADAIRLSTVLQTAGKGRGKDIARANSPIVVPLAQALSVHRGQTVLIRGFLNHRTTDSDGRATGSVVPSHLDISVGL